MSSSLIECDSNELYSNRGFCFGHVSLVCVVLFNQEVNAPNEFWFVHGLGSVCVELVPSEVEQEIRVLVFLTKNFVDFLGNFLGFRLFDLTVEISFLFHSSPNSINVFVDFVVG